MSSDEEKSARVPKRERGKQRVAELLKAAAEVFAEKGYEAATMTEIAARAGAPIGSLYQFFPAKEALADTLVQNYATLISEDLDALEARVRQIDISTLVEALFGLLRAHPQERAAALPLAEARMDLPTRRATFRAVIRRRVAGILQTRAPGLTPEAARDLGIVVLQLMKAANSLADEEGLPAESTAMRELQGLAVRLLEERLQSS